MFGCNFSMLNYDTIGGGIFGSLRLGWNAGMMHANVYPSLFTYPTMDFCGFTPYQQFSNSNWLLDPGFALQSTFMNMQNYSCFGAGMMQPIQQTAWPWAGASIGGSTKTAEEKAQEKELNNLKAVAKEVVEKLSGDSKTTLQTAIDKKDGTVAEKIAALENALKEEAVKAEIEKLLLNNPPSNLKVGNKTLLSILKGEGVHLISDVADSKITDMNTKAECDNGITENEVTLLAIGENNVLDFIDGLETFDLIDGKNKELFDKLTSSLKELAEEVQNNADINDNLKAKVVEYRTKESLSIVDFKNLYAAVLLAVSELADKKLEEATGGALDGIVADNFYTTEAKEVLKAKGVTEDIITSIQATPVAPTPGSNPGQESEEYKPTTTPVKINFGPNEELQKAHDAAARVIAEALYKIDKGQLTCTIDTDGDYRVNLNNGNYVVFRLDNTGDIKYIWVSYDGNSENKSDIIYRKKADGTFDVSCTVNEDNTTFPPESFVSMSEGDFDALTKDVKSFIPAVQKAEAKKIDEKSFYLNISDTNLKDAYSKAKEVLLEVANNFDKVTFRKDSTDKKIRVMLDDKNILLIALNDDKTLKNIQIEYGANDCSSHFDSKIEFSTNKFMTYSDNNGSCELNEQALVNTNTVKDIKDFAQLLVDKYRTTQAS